MYDETEEEDKSVESPNINSSPAINASNRFVVRTVSDEQETVVDGYSISSRYTSQNSIVNEDDGVSIGNVSTFSQITANIASAPGNFVSLLSDPGSIFGSSILLASQSYLNIYQDVNTGESNRHLDDVMEEDDGDIFDNPEYIDTLEGKLPLAEAARMIAKDSTRHRSLFDESHVRATRTDCYKRLACISVAMLLLFSTSFSVRFTSSSLGEDKQLLLVCYGSVFSLQWLGGVCATPIMNKLRPKWTMVLATSGFIAYPLSMFYMSYYTTLPASMFCGFCTGLIFAVEGVYLINMASTYALVSGEELADVIGRFNGFVYSAFLSSNIFGNLLSSLLLSNLYTLPGELVADIFPLLQQQNFTVKATSNDTGTHHHVPLLLSNSSTPLTCGLTYYEQIKHYDSQPTGVYIKKQYIFYGVACILSILASLIIAIFLRRLKVAKHPGSSSIVKSMKLLLTTLADSRNLLLMPSVVYLGLAASIILADYSASFVSCSYGVDKIGYVIMTAFIFSALGSALSGKVVLLLGRVPVLITSLLINLSSVICVLLWKPAIGDIQPMAFLAPCLWAFSDGVLHTQTQSFLGVMFRRRIVQALTTFLTYLAAGALFGTFSMALGLFSMTIKLYLVIGFGIIGVVSYSILEFLLKKEVL